MMSQTGQEIITIHILSDISRSKGNQTIKFGPLINITLNNNLFEKLCTKCNGQARRRPFYKNTSLSISLDINNLKCYVQVVVYQLYQN